jgi:hypothetical protein
MTQITNDHYRRTVQGPSRRLPSASRAKRNDPK